LKNAFDFYLTLVRLDNFHNLVTQYWIHQPRRDETRRECEERSYLPAGFLPAGAANAIKETYIIKYKSNSPYPKKKKMPSLSLIFATGN